MSSIYREVETAVRANLLYSAIAVTVSLPDICATLEGSIPTSRETYKAWFRQNVAKRFGQFTEHECWELRCGVLHNAKFQGGKQKFSRFDKVIFCVGDGVAVHEGVLGSGSENVLVLDVPTFCHEMISAAREWEASRANDPVVQGNMDQVVRLRPNGIRPWIVGIPVIA